MLAAKTTTNSFRQGKLYHRQFYIGMVVFPFEFHCIILIIMTKEIFISYSRRDQEFVARLAANLNEQVAGVWFDQAAIQVGQKWHDEIMDGIQECKVFVLVLSPDAVESRYVREEVNKALELGKVIIPVLYRAINVNGELQSLIQETQTLDLRKGSYTDNFQTLVDGIEAAGATRRIADRENSFLRQSAKTSWSVVFGKIPGWAFSWSLGWLAFWSVIVLILIGLLISNNDMGGDDLLLFGVILISGGVGGFCGGLIAGLFTMIALRPNAPSISWKHMSPTIRIWAISGPLGMLISGALTAAMLAVGAIGMQTTDVNCDSATFSECVGQIIGNTIGDLIGTLIIIFFVFFVFVVAAWFLTGMFAGWLSVRHIRRLEPGITTKQSWSVSTGWGCGALVAAVVTILAIGVISSLFGVLGA